VWNDWVSGKRIFSKLCIWEFLLKSFDETEVLLKSNKSNGRFTERPNDINDDISPFTGKRTRSTLDRPAAKTREVEAIRKQGTYKKTNKQNK